MLGGAWALAWPGHRFGINRNRKQFRDTTSVQGADDSVNEFAMKVVKDSETVGHLPREYL